jgi:hypothetical protein
MEAPGVVVTTIPATATATVIAAATVIATAIITATAGSRGFTCPR